MRHFTKIDEKNIQINALFIQPTNLCALNCKGCYVKAWGENTGVKKAGKHVPESAWLEFMTIMAGLHSESNYHTNQMTLALDTVPEYEPDDCSDIYMKDVAWMFVDVARRSQSFGLDTEFHMTTQSISNLFDQNQYGGLEMKLNHISMVSISSLQRKDIVQLGDLKEKYKDLHINWNLHPASVQDESKLDKYAREIAIIARFVDSIYLVMHKPDLGIDLDKNLVRQYFLLYKKIKVQLVKDGQDPNKIQIDGCIKDSKKFSEQVTGGCSSNISRFQVWPDGSVSGCPYSHRPITKPAIKDVIDPTTLTVDNMLNNIRAAAKIYQFNNCKIPASLYPDSVGVAKRKYRALQIFED